MGKITDVVRKHVPASYKAMCAATNPYYSLELLQDLADYVKYRLYSTVVAEEDEATVYNPKERELLGILTAIQFIPAAVDYWGSQSASLVAGGGSGMVNETETFFDRRADLWKIFTQLQEEAGELSVELGVFSKVAVLPSVSYGDNGRDILVTEDPERFPRAYPKRNHYHRVPWSPWSA